MSGSTFLDGKLGQLQNLVKRDPVAYKEEFQQQHRHFLSELEIYKLDPAKKADHFSALISFLAHVAQAFPKELANFPEQISLLLEEHYEIMARGLRKTMVQSLILMRNRNMISPLNVLQLSFILFRCQDKNLRALLYNHIINDVKRLNEKSNNVKINKQLQNFLYKMLDDNNGIAAKKSLDVMVDLYRKRIWTDARTVNVIATACISNESRLVKTGIRFFLGIEQLIDDDEANEDEEQERASYAQEVLAKKTRIVHKKTGKRMRAKRKAEMKAKKVLNAEEERKIGPRFPAIQLINDPQGLAEKLFKRLRDGKESFDTRCLQMNLISRLIGVHRLFIINFYSFLQRYFNAHQREVTRILSYFIQALHIMIPPEELEPMVQTVANNFVTDRYSGEVIAVGINTLREIVSRVPLLLEVESLTAIWQDCVGYRHYRGDKNVTVSARSMLNLLRELKPSLLKKRERGKDATIGEINGTNRRLRQYGESNIIDHIAGTELLPEYENGELEDEDGWEIDSDDSDDDDNNGWITVEHSSDEDDNNGSDEEEDTANADERRGIVETDIVIRNGTLTNKTLGTSKQTDRLEATRILTPRDFERLKELQKKAAAGKKRKRSAADHYATPAITYAYSTNTDDGTIVDPGDLEGYRVQKRRDLKERMAAVREGQEGQEWKAPQRTHGMSNREKEKTRKNFLMITKKRSVLDKQRMSLMQQKKALKSHKMGMKKKTKLMSKLRGRRKAGR